MPPSRQDNRIVVVTGASADADQVEAAAGKIEYALGPIDDWINNAMTSVFSPVKKMTAHEFKRITEVTCLDVVYATLAPQRGRSGLPIHEGLDR